MTDLPDRIAAVIAERRAACDEAHCHVITGIGMVWHTGRKVGRTVYWGDGPDDLIGVMNGRDLADHVARYDPVTVLGQIAECRAYLDALENIAAEHPKSDGPNWMGNGPGCLRCAPGYPCVTMRAVAAALGISL